MASDPLILARDRAVVLAKDGEHASWPSIVAVLAADGYGAGAIKTLGRDQAFQREIAALIHAAIANRPAAPAQTWRISDPESRAKLKP